MRLQLSLRSEVHYSKTMSSLCPTFLQIQECSADDKRYEPQLFCQMEQLYLQKRSSVR